MEPVPSLYDAVPYPSTAHSQTHPDRLAAIAWLYGLSPAPVDHCRILEIGCGDGANLVPIAAAFPGSECFGIDLSTEAVDRAGRFITACGLRNVAISRADLTAPDAVQGHFDYILCHGLYSWVSAATREALLTLCRKRLTPHGLAFISFNTLPGAHLRQAVREILRWHTRQLPDPGEQLEEAQALATFLSSARTPADAASTALRAEFRALLEKHPGHVYHDDLAPENTPCYFHEFVEALHQRGLEFVADTDPGDFILMNLAEEQRRIVEAFTEDRHEREQYLDFLLARRFRQAIVGLRDLPVAERPQPDALSRCWFASSARSTTPEAVLQCGTTARFELAGGPRLQTDFLEGKIALSRLCEHWPRRIPFAELEQHCRERRADLEPAGSWSDEKAAALRGFLLEAASARIVNLHAAIPRLPQEPGDWPRAFPPARVEAAGTGQVTNAYHLRLQLEERWVRELIARADGTRHRSELQSKVAQLAAEAGALGDPGWVALSSNWESAWRRLAALGLFVP